MFYPKIKKQPSLTATTSILACQSIRLLYWKVRSRLDNDEQVVRLDVKRFTNFGVAQLPSRKIASIKGN
ncbi:MAG: hypothetical protein WA919_13465 [Coleofasciculaceae cyanobacterium]